MTTTTTDHTVYGLPALPVVGSDGDATLYLFRVADAGLGELRAWELTTPAGVVRRVAERWSGYFRCSCPDYWFRRRFDLDPQCKHVRSVRAQLQGQT